jgi:transketolase
MSQPVYVPPREFQRLLSLKADDARKAAVFADACRLNALYAIKRAGSGHIGSTFSSLDIVTWLHLVEMGADDVYFSSKGHDVPGLYAVLTALGRLDFGFLHKLRRLGGLPGHPDVYVPGIAANTGSLGMGISKAKGMVLARRLQKKPGRIFVMTGDGELQEGQFWESLPQASHLKMGEITVLADHNKIQSDLWVSKVSDLGDLAAKVRAFGWHVETCDGHDFAALAGLLERLESVKDKPKFVVAQTVKGKGVSFMEGMKQDDRLYHYHSGAPGDVEYGKAVEEILGRANGALKQAGAAPLELKTEHLPPKPPIGKPQNLLAAYSQELVRQAEKNPRLVVLDADLVKDCGLLPFEKKFPDRFVECGIAEQDMVSQAGGLARQGMLPIVHSFSCFLSARPNEQIYNNALEKDKVIYVGSLAGFLPAGPGTSHQAVRDISTLCAVPGLNVIEPSCTDELAQALDFAVNGNQDSAYLRLVSVSCDVPYRLPEGYKFLPGRGAVLREGEDAVVFGSGLLLLTQAWEAAQLLASRGIRIKVVNMPWLNRVDVGWLKETVTDIPWVFTLDNHYLNGGLGERLLAALVESGAVGFRARRFGLTRTPFCGAYDEVLKAHRLDAASLAEDIASALVQKERPLHERKAVSSVADSDIG